MTALYPVELTAPHLPVAGDRPVVFHGVNKSGSLAMADVMLDAYRAAGRAEEFVSHYHRCPLEFADFATALRNARAGGFFVAHYIYGGITLPPDAILVTQVRHPLPRTLSVYGWLKRNYINKHGTLDRFPDLAAWLASTRGKRQTQMAQLALGFGDCWQDTLRRSDPSELCERAIDNLHRDFAWVGLAELFEESIFTLAEICELPAVPPWVKDTRNRWRQSLRDTDDRSIEMIRETFAWEFTFYERVVALVKERFRGIDFGRSIERYRERCSDEYGERLLTDGCIT